MSVGAWSNLLKSTSGFIGFDEAPTKIMTKQYSMNDSLKNHLAGVKIGFICMEGRVQMIFI